jgi:glucose-6-phosphate 1-epimerase
MDAAGQVVLRLGISDDPATRAIWDFAFDLELLVTVGHSLSLALITRNTGAVPFSITQALHTYFCTGDIAQTSVTGLDGCTYLDKVQNQTMGQQFGAVRFAGEIDRVYLNTQSDCLIKDDRSGRTVRIAKTGSASTVVWNPWHAKEKTFTDMASGEYQQMLCVETCNAGPDQITLAPGSQHALSACVSLVV